MNVNICLVKNNNNGGHRHLKSRNKVERRWITQKKEIFHPIFLITFFTKCTNAPQNCSLFVKITPQPPSRSVPCRIGTFPRQSRHNSHCRVSSINQSHSCRRLNFVAWCMPSEGRHPNHLNKRGRRKMRGGRSLSLFAPPYRYPGPLFFDRARSIQSLPVQQWFMLFSIELIRFHLLDLS